MDPRTSDGVKNVFENKQDFSMFYYYSSILLKIMIWRDSRVFIPGLSGFLSAHLTGNRQHLLATLLVHSVLCPHPKIQPFPTSHHCHREGILLVMHS